MPPADRRKARWCASTARSVPPKAFAKDCSVWTGLANLGATSQGRNLAARASPLFDDPVQKELVSVLRNNGHSFRLICTSDEDLEKLTDEGRFNDELFYRVAALPIALPPLRERLDDLAILIKHFTRGAANPHFDASLVEFSEDAMAQIRLIAGRGIWPNSNRCVQDCLHQ